MEAQLAAIVRQLEQLQLENKALHDQVGTLRHHTSTRVAEPKISLPDKFDGTRSKLRSFLTQVRLVFMMHPSRYPNEQSQVGLVGSLLTGSAAKWFAPLMEKNSPLLYDFEQFVQELEATFGDTDKVRASITKMQNLMQGSRPASTYASEFRQLACDVPYDDYALREQFRRGLRDEVKDLLITMPDPSSLSEAISFAVKCDNRLHERKQEMRPRSSVPRSVPTNPAPRPAPAAVSNEPTPMQIDRSNRGPLSNVERQRRLQNNLCLYCGGAGHRAITCPVKVSRIQVRQAQVNTEEEQSENELDQSE
jgi:Ty3 transposon capsid-like protein